MKTPTFFLTLIAMSVRSSSPVAAGLIESVYGKMLDGREVKLYTLTNASGMEAKITEYGAILVSLKVPDKDGKLADVTQGYDTLEGWLGNSSYFGATVGRFGNRIAGGKFSLDGKEYTLVTNNDPGGMPCALHGGTEGFCKKLWKSEVVKADGTDAVRLTYVSADGEEGYPGNLDIAITYTLTAKNEFIIESDVTSDQVTPLSLANHSYFNLAGEGTGSVAEHIVQIMAEEFVGTDNDMTLSDRRDPVADTPSDFRTARRLGDALPHMHKSHGENYLLRSNASEKPTLIARVTEPDSGRVLEVLTNDTCLHFYSGVSLDGTLTGKSGQPYNQHGALCLECQGYPNGSSRPELGDILVHPGTPQRRTTIYAFSTQ